MIEVVRLGDKIKDNDPRTENRLGEVIAFQKTRLRVKWEITGVKTYVSLNRVFDDGKIRKTGYSLVHA